MKIQKKEFTKSEILARVGSISQVAGVKRYVMNEGPAKGMSVMSIRNGNGLEISILEDKCLDIFDVSYSGIPLAWISKNGMVANQHFDGKGIGWLRSFGGGMLVTCGLRNVGGPEKDGPEEFGLHGRITAMPARNVAVREYWKENIYHVEISGVIRETNVFGENLALYRTVKINSDEPVIRLQDKIINEGFEKQQIMVLYHLNWGFPLLDENAELILNSASIEQRGENQSDIPEWNKFSPPVQGFSEKVFFHDLIPDNQNRVNYQLNNPALGVGVKVSWEKSQLPFMTQWKMLGQSEYVLGLEPGNSLPVGRNGIRERGLAEFLEPLQEKDVWLEIKFVRI